MKEQISALVDGEANDIEREQALRALRNDPKLVQTWDCYHLVSTAMRRELDFVVGNGLADRVRSRLEQESPEKVGLVLAPRMLKLTAGMAIAASVAAVAILNLSSLTSPAGSHLASSSTGATAVARSQPLPPEKQRVLNPYLVHHAEFSSALGVNRIGAYARVVGRDSIPAETSTAE